VRLDRALVSRSRAVVLIRIGGVSHDRGLCPPAGSSQTPCRAIRPRLVSVSVRA
jgi:hypothetical protein